MGPVHGAHNLMGNGSGSPVVSGNQPARHNPVLLLTLGAFIVVSLVMPGGACGSSGTTTVGVRGANLARKHVMLQISRLGPAAARLPS
jgi:hypothetical protein